MVQDYQETPVINEGELPPPPVVNIKRDPMEISELVSCLVDAVDKYKQLLENIPSKFIATSVGKIEALGQDRLIIVELFDELLRVNRSDIYEKYKELGIFDIIIDLFFKFRWNNILHAVVVDMLNITFESDQSELIEQLIHKLSDLIITANRTENDDRLRAGYMGHITLMVDKIQFILIRRDIQMSEGWSEYIQKTYKEIKERDTKPLGHRYKEVDVETDQLARYMIQQLSMNVPSFSLQQRMEIQETHDDPFRVDHVEESGSESDDSLREGSVENGGLETLVSTEVAVVDPFAVASGDDPFAPSTAAFDSIDDDPFRVRTPPSEDETRSNSDSAVEIKETQEEMSKLSMIE